MTDPGVQLVREWLQRQPFSLRFLTLLLFMEEAVREQFGEETLKSFEDELRNASGIFFSSSVRDFLKGRSDGFGILP
jgi:hypothetical protein